MTPLRIIVLADTHIRPGRARRLPGAVYAALHGADAILHAGDVVTRDLLDELGGFAPVRAVLGNNDDAVLAGLLPEARVEVFGGARIGMVHDSGPTPGRAARLRRRFPHCDLVVYGHSHVPFDGPGLDGQRLLNPGSPTERRAQPAHTYGVVEVADGRLRTEICTV